MLDTLTLADRLTEAGFEQKQANAIHDAQGEIVSKDDLEHLATKVDLASLEVRLTWRVIGALVAVAGIQTAAIVAALRFLG